MQALVAQAESSGSYSGVVSRLGSVFCDPELVADSFSNADGEPNLEDVRGIFALVEQVDEPPTVQNALRNALQGLAAHLAYPIGGPPFRRLVPVLVALEYEPFSYDPELVNTLSALFQAVASVPEEARERLVEFWQGMPAAYLERLVGVVQMNITLKSTIGKAVANFAYVKEGVVVLDVLHRVNQLTPFVPYSEFYNSAINELATEFDDFLRVDLASWFKAHENAKESGRPAAKEAFCDYSFLLDPGSKARILQLEARVQQHMQLEDSMRTQMFGGPRRRPFFLVRVRRDEIVDDVLDVIAQSDSQSLKMPLRVHFEGEEGVDEGGVKKEFFLLLVRKLLDPQFGMFTMDEESRKLWFNPNTFEFSLKFELCGILIGLAIYNGVILDVHFPVALYRKLLGQKPTLADLVDYSPRLGRSLQQLLEFDGDVENTFGLTFQVAMEAFGSVNTVELKPGGGDIAVTAENRAEYVDLYVDHILNQSVAKIYAPFHKGFNLVCGGTFLEMFRPEEMELLLCGSPDLDFHALERSCHYDDGFTESSPTIQHFWSVVHGMTEDQKKKFLMFTTGSDRVPIRGLSALRLTISRNGDDSDRLPVAHTCFSHLLLPEYASLEKLRDRLLLAIEHSQGFGTM